MMTRLTIPVVVLLLGTAMVSPPAAGTSSFGGQPVPAAETMVIEWEGAAGIQIALPEGVVHDKQNTEIELLDDGKVAFVSWETPGCGDNQPGERWQCLLQQIMFTFADDTVASTTFTGFSTEYTPGVHTLYLFSDGAARLTLGLDGLPAGSRVEVDAVGGIDATLERLPCTAEIDCDHLAHGGITRDVGHGRVAAVWALAFSSIHDQPPPGTSSITGGNNYSVVGARSCVYPGMFFEDQSPDPEDYPYGCKQGTEDGDVDGINNVVSDHIQHALRLSDRGSMTYQVNINEAAQGDVYAGFQAERFDALESYHPPEGIAAGWGIWFYQGVTCPCS